MRVLRKRPAAARQMEIIKRLKGKRISPEARRKLRAALLLVRQRIEREDGRE